MNRRNLVVVVAGLLFGLGISAAGAEIQPITVDAPPFGKDLSKRAMLTVHGGAPIAPSSWTVRQTGHMGHHLRGQLVFPAEADGRPVPGPGAKSFELRLGGAQSEPQAAFLWTIVGR
jgi:hypothetical protein